jgi:hypothetical protein
MKFENFDVMYLNIKPEIGKSGGSGDWSQGVANNPAY